MSDQVNRCYRLRRRPQGAVAEADLELLREPLAQVGAGQALIRTLWLSLDPTNRVWMSDARSYMPAVAIDAVMRGVGIGQVVESQREDMRRGDLVSGLTGWQDYAVADDRTNELPFAVLPSPLPAPLSVFLGALGHTGVTAYLGVQDICKPQPGDTMVVTAAAGAVGSVAGQLGKARGARVVGITGSAAKCRHIVDDLGLDAGVNHSDPDWREQLDAATTAGVDVVYENVGGPIMDHLLGRLNLGARIALCGMISEYNTYGSPADRPGQRAIMQLVMSRASIAGFLVFDHVERFTEAIEHLAGLMAEGKLKYEETVVDGLERAGDAVNGLFEGTNTGKLLVKVAEPVIDAPTQQRAAGTVSSA
jgi:NADPH-dependent curcumin reductase CurA